MSSHEGPPWILAVTGTARRHLSVSSERRPLSPRMFRVHPSLDVVSPERSGVARLPHLKGACMFDDRPAFGVRIRVLGGLTVAELSGELDIFAAARISARLESLVHVERPDLLLDLRPVTFLDCAGLSLLCRLRNRVLDRDGRLRLVIGNPRLLRVLRMVRLADAFEILDDLAPVVLRPEEVGASESNGVVA